MRLGRPDQIRERGHRLLVLLAAALATLSALSFAVDHRLIGDRRAIGLAVSAFMAPYQEWLLASLPGEPTPQYVVFLTGDADDGVVDAFFASQTWARRSSASTPSGLLLVTLTGDPQDALQELREKPWVQLAVRDQGLFFCH